MDSLFHPLPNPLPKENRIRYRKIRVRQSRARIFLQFAKDEHSSFASLSTLSTGKNTGELAALPVFCSSQYVEQAEKGLLLGRGQAGPAVEHLALGFRQLHGFAVFSEELG